MEAPFAYDVEPANAALATVMSVNVAAAVDARLAVLGRALADDDLEPFTRVLYDAWADDHGHRGDRRAPSAGTHRSRGGAVLRRARPAPHADACRSGCPSSGGSTRRRPETMVRASAFAAFTGIFNTTGHPAMSVPMGTDARRPARRCAVRGPVRRRGDAPAPGVALEAAAPWPTAPVVPLVPG